MFLSASAFYTHHSALSISFSCLSSSFSVPILNAVLPPFAPLFIFPWIHNPTSAHVFNFHLSLQVPNKFLPLTPLSGLPTAYLKVDVILKPQYHRIQMAYILFLIYSSGIKLFLHLCPYITLKWGTPHQKPGCFLKLTLLSFPVRSPPPCFWNPPHVLIYSCHRFSSNVVVSCFDQTAISAPVLRGIISDLMYYYFLT